MPGLSPCRAVLRKIKDKNACPCQCFCATGAGKAKLPGVATRCITAGEAQAGRGLPYFLAGGAAAPAEPSAMAGGQSAAGGRPGGLVGQAGFVYEKPEGAPDGPAGQAGRFAADQEGSQPELPFRAVGVGKIQQPGFQPGRQATLEQPGIHQAPVNRLEQGGQGEAARSGAP